MDHEFGYLHRPFLDICLQTKHSSMYRLVMYMLWLGRIMYKLRNCYRGKRKSSLSRPSNNCIKMGERVSQQRSPENSQTNSLVFFIKIRSKLHGLLSRRNTASHRCCFLQGLRRSPSAFPFSVNPSGIVRKTRLQLPIHFYTFISKPFIVSFTFSHRISPLITQAPAAPTFRTALIFSLLMPPMA